MGKSVETPPKPKKRNPPRKSERGKKQVPVVWRLPKKGLGGRQMQIPSEPRGAWSPIKRERVRKVFEGEHKGQRGQPTI